MWLPFLSIDRMVQLSASPKSTSSRVCEVSKQQNQADGASVQNATLIEEVRAITEVLLEGLCGCVTQSAVTVMPR